MSRFDDVQEAAKRRVLGVPGTADLAAQIVASAGGDARMAYEYLDTLNIHVTRLLQAKELGQ
jgi:Cdc6-like AAA superfamily ATPase